MEHGKKGVVRAIEKSRVEGFSLFNNTTTTPKESVPPTHDGERKSPRQCPTYSCYFLFLVVHPCFFSLSFW